MNDKTNQLVTIEPTKVYEVFTTPNGVYALLEQINSDALAIVPDLSTDKSRKAIASVAYKVSQAKSYLDGLGKEVTDKLKELPKTVDANRKHLRDTLDALRDKVRQPLTDWEAEQARIEAERVAREAAAKLAAEVEACHELGLLMLADFDRKKAEEKAEAERIQKEREAEIAANAAKAAREQAEREAKDKAAEVERLAAKERERVAQEALAQKLAIEKAEREKVAAEQRHAKQLQDAKELAERQSAEAVEKEKRRIENERLAAEAEQKRREADTAHRKAVNNAALQALMIKAELTESQGKEVLKAIANGLIPNVAIKY